MDLELRRQSEELLIFQHMESEGELETERAPGARIGEDVSRKVEVTKKNPPRSSCGNFTWTWFMYEVKS
jgi:hypothetical protein